MNDTQDRIALVTGGTRGIGAAISTRLAQTGARVAAVYNRDFEAADAFEAHYLTGTLIPVAGGWLMM